MLARKLRAGLITVVWVLSLYAPQAYAAPESIREQSNNGVDVAESTVVLPGSVVSRAKARSTSIARDYPLFAAIAGHRFGSSLDKTQNFTLFRVQGSDADDSLLDLEDVTVSEEEGDDAFSWGRFIEETLSAEVGASYLGTDDGYRQSRYAEIGFRWSVDWFTLVLRGRSSNYSLEYERKVRAETPPNVKVRLKKREKYTYKYSNDELSEGYLQLKLGSFMLFSAGRQRIVWGQFNMFSPVDYMSMPIRSDSTGSGVSKLESRLPQDVAALYTFFTPKIELQLYYFPKLTFDPLNKRIIDRPEKYYKPVFENSTYSFEDVSSNTVYPKKSERPQKAARLMFYLDFATFGFTYYDGWRTQFSVGRDRLKTTILTGDKYHYPEKRKELQKVKLKGFEAASRSGNWTWKLEVASLKDSDEYDVGINRDDNNSPGYYPTTPDMKKFITWVHNKNKSRLYRPYTVNFWALGVDAEPGRWVLNLVLFYMQQDKDAATEEGKKLYDKAKREDESDINFAPGVHVSRYVGSGQDSQWGVLGGMIGVGAGASVYFRQRWNEYFLWSVNAEAIEYFANEDLDDLDGDGNYERTETSTAGVRATILINL